MIMANEYSMEKVIPVSVPTYLAANGHANGYRLTVTNMILVPSVVHRVPMMEIPEPPDVIVVVKANRI